jgi:preprotein translocase subunit SecB
LGNILGGIKVAQEPIENGKSEEKVEQKPLKMQILAQYIRDMSFENILAQKGISGEAQPEVSVQVNIDAKKRPIENQFEVIIKTEISSKTKDKGEPMFVIELEYAGIFHIENLPEDQLHPYLMIECPRMIFPFLRRIISDVTRDGGFPPLNLDSMDFVQLYRNEIQRRVAENEKAKAKAN